MGDEVDGKGTLEDLNQKSQDWMNSVFKRVPKHQFFEIKTSEET